MTTHGRGGLRGAWLGSVADHLIRSLTIPVLVRAPGRNGLPYLGRRRSGRSWCRLTGPGWRKRPWHRRPNRRPVWCGAGSGPGGLACVRRQPAAGAVSRLAMKPRSWEFSGRRRRSTSTAPSVTSRELGVGARAAVVVGHNVAEALLDLAHPQRIDLVTMATHGRSGLKRLLLGSVADKLIRGAGPPVLVVRPRKG